MKAVRRILVGSMLGIAIGLGSVGALAQTEPATVEVDGLLWRHSGWINAIEFSPDYTRLLTSSADGTARVWDYATKRQLLVVGGDHGEVYTAHFSPDGTRIVTAARDGAVLVWDAETGEQLMDLTVTGTSGRPIAATSAVYAPDGTKIVASYYDNNARVFDAATGDLLHVLSGHQGLVWRAAFSPDSSRIVTISYDNTARIWDAETGEEQSVLQHGSLVAAMTFTPDGRLLATGSADGMARLWNPQNGALIAEYPHEQEVRSIAFSSDGRRMVTASGERLTRLWNVTTGEVIARIRLAGATTSDAVPTAVGLSPDGTLLVVGYSDGHLQLRDGTTGELLGLMVGHGLEITAVLFTPDGSHVLTSSQDSNVLSWDLTPFEQR